MLVCLNWRQYDLRPENDLYRFGLVLNISSGTVDFIKHYSTFSQSQTATQTDSHPLIHVQTVYDFNTLFETFHFNAFA
jgi:hypothetical protein